MNSSELRNNPLTYFTQRYQDIWFQSYGHQPKSKNLYGIPSPCIIDSKEMAVFWQPVLVDHHTLNIVEQVINLQIHPDAHLFYGTQYAGDMSAMFDDQSLNLIQVWNKDDFSRLEQNLIAHLTMQKRLKRRPSIFIASTDDETKIISIDNQTGNVVLEALIENKIEILADSLDTFLTEIKPIAQ